ncbi:MAG TPA: hypothetical protein PKV73_20140 [Agriterribacter sp.]|nr:hypothetical protein [Agriterribacter sp.]
MNNLKTLFFILIVSLMSCNDNRDSDIQVEAKGIVLDNQTGKPVPNARVTLLCWRKVRHDEETYDKVDTVANDKGVFEVQFPEGFKIDIGSVANNYHPSAIEIKDLSKASHIELRLNANTAIGSVKDLGQLPVFVRNYNTNSTVKSKYYGIDILNGVNTSSLDSIDISIEIDEKQKYPRILITSEKGGIVPISRDAKNDLNKAPAEGYVKKYELRGNEKGFFIKCRDGKTYARLLIFSLEYDRSSPYADGHFNDYGIMFNVVLQTKGTEFNTPDNIRLDHYILETI